MKQSRIYIGGNIYGAGNIGDDAALAGILLILELAAPGANITIGTYNGKNPDNLSPALQYVNSYDMLKISSDVRHSDCFISGGGTMIGDEIGLSFPLKYNAQLISIAKLYGKRTVMMAIGANKLQHDNSMKIARTIFSLTDLVTVRDEESRRVCLELGSEPNRTAITADPAFLLDARETPRTKEIKERLRARGRTFGINVVNESWADINEYKMGIARACNYLASKYGYLPVFFCNEVRPGKFYDFAANSQTAAMLRCEHELMEPIYYSPEEMIDIISVFDFTISMRMHSLIFAAVAGTPFVAVSRVDKVDNFMRQFGLNVSGTVDNCDGEQLITDIERLLENREAYRNRVAERVAILRQNCLKNIDLLSNLLDERRVLWNKVSVSSLQFALGKNKLNKIFQGLLNREITLSQIVHKLLGIFRRGVGNQ